MEDNKNNLLVDANTDPVCEVLYRLNVGSKIDVHLLEKAFDTILFDKTSVITKDIQLSAILTGIMSRKPRKEEIIALLNSVFKLDEFNPKKRKTIKLPKGKKLIGAIGSGKKGIKTMNISTPALLTAASLGAFTAKNVSHSTSSLTGSADFLELVGSNLDVPFEKMTSIIQEIGFGAFKIEGLLPKFDSIYGQKFLAPHALSFGLAGLASPIKFDNMLFGLAHPDVELSLDVLRHFGVKSAMVVSTTHDNIHYLDEMGIYGKTRLIGMRDGLVGKLKIWNPVKELQLPKYGPSDIAEGKTISENIRLSIKTLKGIGDEAREDVIAINAGTILHLAGITQGLNEGYRVSKQALKTGLPYKKLLEFVKATGGDVNKLERYAI
jgi:anthranilate phosphoribosyltransferase